MKYFTIRELCKSATADAKNIINNPNSTETTALVSLIENCLDPLREAYGKPIKVTSGFRCAKLNKAVGGAATSQHTKGQAADLQKCKGGSNAQIFETAKRQGKYDQLIWEYGTANEPDWVHVSYAGKRNRQQILQAVKRNGITIYLPKH